MSKYRYLLFDLDDTLLDFGAAEEHSFCSMAREVGIPDPEKEYPAYKKINLELWKSLERNEITLEKLKTERFRRVLVAMGEKDDGKTLEMAARMRDLYVRELSRHGEILEGAEEILEQLKGNYTLFLITNGIQWIQESRIDISGIGKYFDAVFTSEAVGASKPDPGFFEAVIDHTGDRDRSRYLVIGDSLTSDCDGAISSGLDICRYNPEGADPEGRELTYDIRELGELVPILSEETEKTVRFAELLGKMSGRGRIRAEILENEPMSRHTTFRIGGPAGVFVTPGDTGSFLEILRIARGSGIPYMVVGNGSNLLFDDAGYRGCVICTSGLRYVSRDGDVIEAGAGYPVTALAKYAADSGLGGLEFAYGIPGTVGGAVFMNAGAYGGEVSQALLSSTCFDPETGEVLTIPAEEHLFGYRTSVYRSNGCVVLSAKFRLTPADGEELAAVRERMADFMNRRVTKQPLDLPSAGSVFKRCEGRFTGQMIEEAGLKGFSIGGARVSEKHAGFIVNTGGATSADVLALIEYIKKTIYERFGCRLECEVIHVR